MHESVWKPPCKDGGFPANVLMNPTRVLTWVHFKTKIFCF